VRVLSAAPTEIPSMSTRVANPPPVSAGNDPAREFLQRVASLVGRHLPTDDFYREYFGLLFALPGVQAVVVNALHGSTFAKVCGANDDALTARSSARQHVLLQTIVRECGERLEVISLGPGEELRGHPGLRNETTLRLIGVPVIFGRSADRDSLQGVELFGFKEFPSEDQRTGMIRLLQACVSYTSAVLRHHRLEQVARSSHQLVSTARLLSEVSGESDLESLGVTIVNHAREILGVDRCALLVSPKHGIFDIVAISNIPSPDKSSALARSMIQLAEDTHRKEGAAVYRKASDKKEAVGTLADFFYYSRSAEVAVLPLKSRQDQVVGMLLAETSITEGLTPQHLELGGLVAAHVGPAVSTALVYSQTPFLSRLQSMALWMQKPATDRRSFLLRRYGIPLGVAALIALFPLRFNVGGDCRLAPLQRAAAVSQSGGRITEVKVADGQAVQAGAVLALTDDSLLKKERDVYVQEAARFEAQANSLRASDDRAGSQIAELQMRQARRQAEIREQMMERAIVRSPINGVVMSQGVLPRVGEVLGLGEPFCVVGNPEQWELTVLVPERDIHRLFQRLDEGPLTVRYLLEAFPRQTMEATLSDATAIAQVAEVSNNRNTFAVRVPVTPDQEMLAAMRSGYTGRAKIQMGWRPLIFVWTHDFLNWWRTRWV